MLSYKDHGMLLCEVHVLRERAQRIIPREIYNEFLEDVNDLSDLRTGREMAKVILESIASGRSIRQASEAHRQRLVSNKKYVHACSRFVHTA